MSVVAFRLAGPMQSWGVSSKFVRRDTGTAPSKSGIIGMVAAAKGLRRTDPLEDLLGLRFGVRIDQPGELMRDFQTEQRPKRGADGTVSWTSLPLSYRYYLADAVFLAVLEGPEELVTAIDEAVRRPVFPLYLGRRSCPPAGPVALGVFDEDLETSLASRPWLAGRRLRKRTRERIVRLETVRDPRDGEVASESVHDAPVSFDPNRRRHAWRTVVREAVYIDNPDGDAEPGTEHNAMSALGV
ncbi:type I-E CRISPR-associated protein Cas5/CasD [Nocardia cyriacigeorgica]|uniref:type I-E CRISPR-associated protein Cas5/CasD n=1 Tax=Nocardia cyriacigeorgica TaxID=135487 RepID=UPI001894DE37|nr:type I-E CRISPR-associated protein Cas5/CasD [Nocardia cyriacigeorgica]MBF6416871.1 type I-E CRISPR-associated protein Cas5/CasD [Nocardia cyriacigeorgica]